MRHKVADIDGPVHYLDFGGTGRPVVMVHGLAGAAINWMAVGPQIATTHRALALDLAGFGETPLFARQATVSANTRLIDGFIKKVAGEPVLLIGNSMGGHISVLEAAAHPELVRSVVLVDAAVPGEHVTRPQPMMLATIAALSVPGLAHNLLNRRLRELGPENLILQTLALVCADPSRVDPAVVEAHVRLTRERARLGPQNIRAIVQATRSIGIAMASPRFWSRVERVKAPTLVVHGSLDRVIPLSAARELVHRRPEWELEVLDGVGHVPMMETPGLFMEALARWSAYRIASAAAAS